MKNGCCFTERKAYHGCIVHRHCVHGDTTSTDQLFIHRWRDLLYMTDVKICIYCRKHIVRIVCIGREINVVLNDMLMK